MSYVCTCANGKTWGAGNQGCNANASNCATCCAGEYGGVAGGMIFTGTTGTYGFSDTEGTKSIIKSFTLNTNNIKESGEERTFTVLGKNGAVFSLQVKNEDNYYYNFATNLFQVTETKLDSIILGGNGFYSGKIKFPAVTDADKYDVYLLAESNYNTVHANYKEVRFSDGSIDINSSSGSNSNLVQKVIYQTLDVTLTLNSFSPTGIVTGTIGTQVITTSRNAKISLIPFSFTFTVTSLKSLRILKQPFNSDITAYVTRTIGATPLDIEGEDLYPAVTQTDVVNGDFSTTDLTNKIVMDTNVADKMVVGDRITIATTALTDTVDIDSGGEVTSTEVVMDNNVITKMAPGDRVTAPDSRHSDFLNNNLVTVVALAVDGNAKKFSLSEEITIEDGATLVFTSRLNREIITVDELDPDDSNPKEFSMKDVNGDSVNVGILDNTTLSFSNQRNYRWSTNIYGLTPSMSLLSSTYFTTNPVIQGYLTQTTIDEGKPGEYKVDDVRVPALDALGVFPVKTRNSTTNIETITQDGNIVFSEQALKSLGGNSVKMFSYGIPEIKRLTGYDIEFSDLAVALTEITTITTTAPSASTTFNVASAVGIAENISTVSGIGIDTSTFNPTVTSITNIGGATWDNTGGATLTLGAVQTLESGTTLTFPNAGTVATITGNIKVNKVGNENVILSFDLEKFLAMQAAP